MAGGLGGPATRGIAVGPESLVPDLWLTPKQIVSRYDCLSEDALTAAEAFGQLRLKFTDPIQDNYEIIRPIVLFDETVSERSRQTGPERTRIGDKSIWIYEGNLQINTKRPCWLSTTVIMIGAKKA